MIKGGKKRKKLMKNEKNIKNLPFEDKNNGLIYGKVLDVLGNRKLNIFCSDNKERLVNIPGRLKGKKNWIIKEDILLISIREFETNKGDVIYKYDEKEINFMKKSENNIVLLIQSDKKTEDDNLIFEENFSENEINDLENYFPNS